MESKQGGFRQAACTIVAFLTGSFAEDDLETYMRHLHKLADCYRSQQRGFFTEAQFLKFAKLRDPDNLANRILPKPNAPTNITTSEVVLIAEPTPQFAVANGA